MSTNKDQASIDNIDSEEDIMYNRCIDAFAPARNSTVTLDGSPVDGTGADRLLVDYPRGRSRVSCFVVLDLGLAWLGLREEETRVVRCRKDGRKEGADFACLVWFEGRRRGGGAAAGARVQSAGCKREEGDPGTRPVKQSLQSLSATKGPTRRPLANVLFPGRAPPPTCHDRARAKGTD